MNSSTPNLATSTRHGWLAGYHILTDGRVAISLKPLVHILTLVVCATGLLFPGPPVSAAPQIEISFEANSADSQKLIHAQAIFAVPLPVIYNIFNRITIYPMLHDWVRETTQVSENSDSQMFLVKFSFPWPVGSQWSQVEVRHGVNTISWKQVDGSLKTNHGRINFTTVDNKVHIDYQAAIDVGLPELWTRTYKEKFIREFLTAANSRAETAFSTPALVLAAEP